MKLPLSVGRTELAAVLISIAVGVFKSRANRKTARRLHELRLRLIAVRQELRAPNRTDSARDLLAAAQSVHDQVQSLLGRPDVDASFLQELLSQGYELALRAINEPTQPEQCSKS